MKSFIKSLALAALALTASQIAQADDSIIGKWHSEFDSQIGTQKYTYEFKMDGTNLVGHAIGERDNGTNDVALAEVKLDGDKISFTEPLTIQDNDINVEYSGTLTNDELKLHRKIGDFAEYDIVAKRVTEASNDSFVGKWAAQFDSQIGVQNYVYEFKFDGTNYTGTAFGTNDMMTNQTTLQDFSVISNVISFVEPLNLNDQEIHIEYKGTNTSDGIKFIRNVGDFATEDLTAKRITDTATAKP